MRTMPARPMPWTAWTYAAGALLLAAAIVLAWTRSDPATRIAQLQAVELDLTAQLAEALRDPRCAPVAADGGMTAPTTPARSASPAGLASPSTSALSRAALARQLEAASAMVLVQSGSVLGTGTGFFVTDDLLVTNRHVVEHAGGRYVLLISQALGNARRAHVVGLTPDAEPGSPDFALLRLVDGKAPGWLALSQDVEKLSDVVAAGYPGMVVSSDAAFERLQQGDLSSAPDLNLTQGVVQSLQRGPAGTGLVVHTASIAKGNSGGPLVDACGRVVGVNTFINVDRTQSAKVGYAIDSTALGLFVHGVGAVKLGVDTTICRPSGR